MESNMQQPETFAARRAKREAEKQRKKKLMLLVLVCILVLAIGISFFRGSPLGADEQVQITIPEGSTTSTIAEILKENDVISSKLHFILSAKTSEYSNKLRYGTFTFDGSMNTTDILRALAEGGAQKATVRITIPEGYSVERIIKKCTEAGLSSEAEFKTALTADYDFAFLSEIPEKAGQKYRLQGFLFPSTYEFYQTATAEDVIKTLLGEFEKQYSAISDDFSDVYEIVTKASLIERESKLDSENATIAGVINNRLADGMRLQIDATVAYVITDGQYDATRILTRESTSNERI